MLFSISNPTEAAENPKFVVLLFCLFKFVFNVSGLSLLLFDESRFVKFRSEVAGRENVILALYEGDSSKPVVVFDRSTSDLLSKEFVKCSFSDFGEDAEDDFNGWLNRQ